MWSPAKKKKECRRARGDADDSKELGAVKVWANEKKSDDRENAIWVSYSYHEDDRLHKSGYNL